MQPKKVMVVFDDLMRRCNSKAYQTFLRIRNAQTPLQLIHDLQIIMDYLEQHHQKVEVKFKLK